MEDPITEAENWLAADDATHFGEHENRLLAVVEAARELLSNARVLYAPIRPNGEMWADGISDQPQSVFSNVCAWEGFPKGGWEECDKIGWKVIAVKVTPL